MENSSLKWSDLGGAGQSLTLMISPSFQTKFTGAIYPTLSAIGFTIGIVWLANQVIVMNAMTRWLIKIGQLSFVIYVAHFAIVSLLHLAVETLQLEQVLPPSLLLVILFICATFVSARIAQLVHIKIEKPGIEMGKSIIARRSKQKIQHPTAPTATRQLDNVPHQSVTSSVLKSPSYTLVKSVKISPE